MYHSLSILFLNRYLSYLETLGAFMKVSLNNLVCDFGCICTPTFLEQTFERGITGL